MADGIAWLSQAPGRIALLEDDYAQCFNVSAGIPLGFAHRSHWYLVDLKAMNPECGDGRPAPEIVVRYVPPGRVH